ncbi:MAG: 2-hydroxychromene-2-carboxylate isomerase [Myxococcales bacterium]|nr:2-hydroxychromene-2-carboxylate isomerase [Myxococcales bacterium]MCB9577077.1 2-hydroxychromene-2-carboxylate isomerase [Polyangiaceae bacterium]
MKLDFYFDYSCPYAYLASTRIQELAEKTGAELSYRPFLLGGLFRALDGTPSEATTLVPARALHNGLDMLRWAELWGVPLRMPKTHPNRTVTALRATLASGDVPRASKALFAAYWAEGRDLADPAVIAEALAAAGFDASLLLRRAEAPEVKQELRERTDEALRRGVFGAPALFVENELYWGQDRLDFVARALGETASVLAFSPPALGTPPGEVEIFYDFSSPFAYLGALRIDAVAARTGASVRWRPMLLGALFREIGTPDVPLFSFPSAKQRYLRRDLERFAERFDIPFRFPSTFPLRSVLALRVALAAGPHIAEVSRRLFRAVWAEDQDVSDSDVLRRILNDAPALVDRASSAEVKQALRDNTSEAQRRGVCGAPTFAVGDDLYWGQDRLDLVELALRGWRPQASGPAPA